MDKNQLKFKAEKIKSYINQILLPESLKFWDTSHFGFYERLDLQGQAIKNIPKRLMASARQVYVLSSTYEINSNPNKDFVLDKLYNVLSHHFKDHQYGGFVFSIDPENHKIHDAQKDLYGLAFGIFGLSHYYGLSKNPQALELALETLELITSKLKSPYGGFIEKAKADWSYDKLNQNNQNNQRLQNPHMHLLEALLSLYAVHPDAQIARICHDLVDLFLNKFIKNTSGALLEYFDYDWQPLPQNTPNSNLVEPGHHFEWIWLLWQYAKLFKQQDKIQKILPAFWQFAYSHGVDKQKGGVYNQISLSGQVLDANKRLWPSFEYLKAMNAYSEFSVFLGQPLNVVHQAAHLDWLFKHFVSFQEPAWFEFLDTHNRPIPNQQYISSVYHIVMALLDCQKCQVNSTVSSL